MMSKKLSILFVGETTITQNGSIKGYDLTFSVGYEESYLIMKEMLESLGHTFTHIPSHLAARDFPRTLEALRSYDVILFSDIGSDVFLLLPDMCRSGVRTVNLLKLIREYVSEGGGFAMIGGYSTFQGYEAKGNYKDTPIEEILPVTLLTYDDRVEVPEGADLTCDPKRHEILSGFPVQWPYILGYNRLIPKDGADVILTFEKDPIIALGSFGAGRTMAYATDCTAHWAPDAMTGWEYYPILWNRLLQWLAGSAQILDD
ncbi:MAG: glutamine amidotransferase [Eubacteriales bacterium]|nr:glutamine amidotransferase [Eubacteriales bacterium]